MENQPTWLLYVKSECEYHSFGCYLDDAIKWLAESDVPDGHYDFMERFDDNTDKWCVEIHVVKSGTQLTLVPYNG
jgi:hypothetical protein